MPAEDTIRVLLVDSDRESANRLAQSLEKQVAELDIQPVGTADAALDILSRAEGRDAGWDALLCTIGKRHLEGLEFIRRLYEGPCSLPILLIGDKADLESAVEGIKAGASDFLLRGPRLARQIAPRLRRAIDRARAHVHRYLLLPALDSLPDTVLVADPRGRIVAASAGSHRMFARTEDELIGTPFGNLLAGDSGRTLSQEIRDLPQGATLQQEVPAMHSDGRTFTTLLTAVRQAGIQSPFLLILRDISQWKNLQEQLAQQEKLSALGELISSVAHELNNPLTGVLGFSQLVMGYPDCPEKVRRDLRNILQQAQRCERIVHNLLSFARKNKPEKAWIGINGILESTTALLEYRLRVDNIRVIKEFDATLPKTMADFHQLQQVFLNLLNNSRQAIAHSGKGSRLTLRTHSMDDWLRVEIIDDGPGIPESMLARIFDPFFTTKPKGVGSGLGLSLCYGIVSAHGGRIHAQSQEGVGSTLTIDLPVRAPADSMDTGLPEGHRQSTAPARRNVLVVDDEGSILELFFQILKAAGHRVDTARSCKVALRKMEREIYDLLITDLKMPDGDGRELCERWRELYPERSGSILITTGDTANSETRDFLNRSGVHFIPKPFDIKRLMHEIIDILGDVSVDEDKHNREPVDDLAPSGATAS
ncbi:MAG: response regulator [Acidobacteriota bacterium]